MDDDFRYIAVTFPLPKCVFVGFGLWVVFDSLAEWFLLSLFCGFTGNRNCKWLMFYYICTIQNFNYFTIRLIMNIDMKYFNRCIIEEYK